MKNQLNKHLVSALTAPLKRDIFEKSYNQVVENITKTSKHKVSKFEIDTVPGVYAPHETSSTRLIFNNLENLGLSTPFGNKKLLEIGCGAGLISIALADLGWNVSAGDISQVAVDCAQLNAKNNKQKISVLKSDLFESFKNNQYDVIVFNQPFYHLTRNVEEKEIMLSDFGGKIYERFMSDAKNYLNKDGFLIFTYSNCSNLNILEQEDWLLSLEVLDFVAAYNYSRAVFKAKNRDPS